MREGMINWDSEIDDKGSGADIKMNTNFSSELENQIKQVKILKSDRSESSIADGMDITPADYNKQNKRRTIDSDARDSEPRQMPNTLTIDSDDPNKLQVQDLERLFDDVKSGRDNRNKDKNNSQISTQHPDNMSALDLSKIHNRQ